MNGPIRRPPRLFLLHRAARSGDDPGRPADTPGPIPATLGYHPGGQGAQHDVSADGASWPNPFRRGRPRFTVSIRWPGVRPHRMISPTSARGWAATRRLPQPPHHPVRHRRRSWDAPAPRACASRWIPGCNRSPTTLRRRAGRSCPDPRIGAVLASVSKPSFEPTLLRRRRGRQLGPVVQDPPSCSGHSRAVPAGIHVQDGAGGGRSKREWPARTRCSTTHPTSSGLDGDDPTSVACAETQPGRPDASPVRSCNTVFADLIQVGAPDIGFMAEAPGSTGTRLPPPSPNGLPDRRTENDDALGQSN